MTQLDFMVRFDMHTPHIVIRRMSEKAQIWILLYQIVST